MQVDLENAREHNKREYLRIEQEAKANL